MAIRFIKMHGLGNDYVYVDTFTESLSGVDAAELARRVSDRHRGIGGDGLILIAPPAAGVDADVRMIMYNADGSRGEMCGNGIRCVAKYAVERGRLRRTIRIGADRAKFVTDLRIQTDRGVLGVTASAEAGRVGHVRVDMGPPILDPPRIPVRCEGPRCVAEPIEADGQTFRMTCVSMGNPHAVLFVDSTTTIDLARLGPIIERHPRFPNRVNVHVAAAQSRVRVEMRTWERGTGLTQACGTGACATLVAGVLEGRLDRTATLHLPGGELEIEWPTDDGPVYMTGPAEEAFSGEWPGDVPRLEVGDSAMSEIGARTEQGVR